MGFEALATFFTETLFTGGGPFTSGQVLTGKALAGATIAGGAKTALSAIKPPALKTPSILNKDRNALEEEKRKRRLEAIARQENKKGRASSIHTSSLGAITAPAVARPTILAGQANIGAPTTGSKTVLG